MLKYLNGMKRMKLTLSVEILPFIQWWVDASYLAHPDYKGHTGAVMSFLKGSVVSFLRIQKLNACSSMESELVGVEDDIPMTSWCKYFIKSQGYTVEHNILYQYNKSKLLLTNNVRISSFKKTKNIKARYFLAKDKVYNNKLELKQISTDVIWSDVLNKYKRGTPFSVFHSEFVNISKHYDDNEERTNTHLGLFPQEGGGAVSAVVLKQITGVMMNKKDNYIVHHRSAIDK